mgnify:CR=1 FL=1
MIKNNNSVNQFLNEVNNKIRLPTVNSDTEEFVSANYKCDCCNKEIIANTIGLPLKYDNLC